MPITKKIVSGFGRILMLLSPFMAVIYVMGWMLIYCYSWFPSPKEIFYTNASIFQGLAALVGLLLLALFYRWGALENTRQEYLSTLQDNFYRMTGSVYFFEHDLTRAAKMPITDDGAARKYLIKQLSGKVAHQVDGKRWNFLDICDPHNLKLKKDAGLYKMLPGDWERLKAHYESIWNDAIEQQRKMERSVMALRKLSNERKTLCDLVLFPVLVILSTMLSALLYLMVGSTHVSAYWLWTNVILAFISIFVTWVYVWIILSVSTKEASS
ncbi:MAG: hypothetical protein KAT70_00990 [Thermoplasmata archaeon]|nr:hypothetical protein [Thermoplasmata archaeon]